MLFLSVDSTADFHYMPVMTKKAPYANVYRRADVTMVRGEGMYLIDDNEKRYLDCASGIAVNALGHTHPKVVAALQKQSELLWHCSNNSAYVWNKAHIQQSVAFI